MSTIISAGGSWRRGRRENATSEVRVALARPRARVVITVAVVALGAVAALGATLSWWSGRHDLPAPSSDEIAAIGKAAGIAWQLSAYNDCVQFTPLVGDRPTYAASCGDAIHGRSRNPYEARREPHWVSLNYYQLGLYGFPEFVFGRAAARVKHVEIVLHGGETFSTPTVERPPSVDAPLRFYVAELPRGASVDTIVVRDESGTVLERRRCSGCAPKRR